MSADEKELQSDLDDVAFPTPLVSQPRKTELLSTPQRLLWHIVFPKASCLHASSNCNSSAPYCVGMSGTGIRNRLLPSQGEGEANRELRLRRATCF